ncbi:PAS domain-containing protein [Kineococcus sp. R86509]|uniref:PAS domain-containing protein n=1 Tax=Kineococcus sp. R86509 TaxID=3093851 RepID=UPI0036D40E41
MSSAGAVDPLLLRAWQEVAEGIMVLDAATWHVEHVNRAGAAFFGRTPEDLVGAPLPVAFPEEVRAAFHDQLARPEAPDFVAGTGPLPGTDRSVAVRARRLGEHVLCSFRDVTHELRLQEERDRLTDSLRGSLERTSDLLRLSEALTATRTVADVAEVVVAATAQGFGAAYAALSVVDHERRLLRTPFTGELAVGAEQEW